ncbi:MAG: glycosyltransferase family 4 protein [Bacteroidales bacterium]|nr:glycosyltransferase family 4 protein [Bacteroidales bacterium]
MKILYIQDWFGFGGINRVTSCKENYLVNHGYEIHNLCMDDRHGIISDYKYDNKIIFHSLFKDDYDKYLKIPLIGRIIRFIKFRFDFIKLILKIKPNIIVTVRDYIEPFTVILFTFNIKRILEYHCAYLESDISLIGKIKKWFKINIKLRFYNIVSLTEKDKTKRQLIYKQKIYSIPNPIYLNPSSAVERENIVVSLGRYNYQKGYDLLIPKWIEVKNKFPNWKLEIYGYGEDEFLYRELIKKYDLNNVISLLPPVKDVEYILQKSSIYVMSSRYEGFPLVLGEAMQCGLPCVSVDCPAGPSEIINNNEDGFVVKELDMDALIEKVCFLIENKNIRTQMSQKASLNIKRYEMKNVMEMWVNLFNNI